MTPPASTEPMPKVNIHRNFMVEFSHHKKVKPDENYPDGDYRFASGWLSQKHPYGYNIDYFETRDDAISAIERCNKENPQDPGYWLTYIVYSLTDVTRARGPVVAQQVPAQRYFPIASCYECANRMRMHELYKPYGMMILPEGKESTDFMGRWVCTEKDDQEIIGDEIPSWCPLSKGISSPDHDAALIAQEREKWEREHTPTFHAENPGVFSPWYNVEMVAARVRSSEKKAREDVLDELAQMYANVPEQFLEGTYRLHSEWKEKIESLRHGQQQEREPE